MKLCGEAWLSTGDPWVPDNCETCMGLTCECLDVLPGFDDLDDVAPKGEVPPLSWGEGCK